MHRKGPSAGSLLSKLSGAPGLRAFVIVALAAAAQSTFAMSAAAATPPRSIVIVPLKEERFTEAGCKTWKLPKGAMNVGLEAVGAAGESDNASSQKTGLAPGGAGDGISVTDPGLEGGQALYVCVDVGGGSSSNAGGGASGVSLGEDFGDPLVVAGGGGGAGPASSCPGFGAGGDAGEAGQAGENFAIGPCTSGDGGSGGNGATETEAGQGGLLFGEEGHEHTSSGPGAGGSGAPDFFSTTDGGGGGAGYYGGGGGGASPIAGNGGGAGGGGSDFCALAGCEQKPGVGTSTAAGSAQADAKVRITWIPPAPTCTQISGYGYANPAGKAGEYVSDSLNTSLSGTEKLTLSSSSNGRSPLVSLTSLEQAECSKEGTQAVFSGQGTATYKGKPGYSTSFAFKQSGSSMRLTLSVKKGAETVYSFKEAPISQGTHEKIS